MRSAARTKTVPRSIYTAADAHALADRLIRAGMTRAQLDRGDLVRAGDLMRKLLAYAPADAVFRIDGDAP
jgi:hypothetical protein